MARKKTDEMRVAILRCAAEVFSQREYHEVLTDEIALKLGIGKGTLYRYFPSKEELYFATVIAGLDGMHEAVIAVAKEPASLERMIERLVHTVLEYFWDRRDFFVLLYRMEPKLDPEARAEWQQRRAELIDLLAAALQKSLPAGSGVRARARLAVEMLLGMVRSVCMYRGSDDSIDALARLVTGVFLHGIGDAPRVRPALHPVALAGRRSRGGSQAS